MDMVLDTVDSDMAMDLDTMAIMDLDTTDTARGLLMLSLRPRLIRTTDTDMVWDTDVDSTVAISDTLDTSLLRTRIWSGIQTWILRWPSRIRWTPRLRTWIWSWIPWIRIWPWTWILWPSWTWILRIR